jgi:hypothetical protein
MLPRKAGGLRHRSWVRDSDQVRSLTNPTSLQLVAPADEKPIAKSFHALLDPHALSVNSIFANPTVNPATVIADLETLSLNRFDQVQVLETVHFAQDDIANFQLFNPDWDNCTKLPGFDFAGHGIAPWPKLNGFASLESINVSGGPAHIDSTKSCTPDLPFRGRNIILNPAQFHTRFIHVVNDIRGFRVVVTRLPHGADIHEVLLAGFYFEFDIRPAPDRGIADESDRHMRMSEETERSVLMGEASRGRQFVEHILPSFRRF